MAEGGGKTLVRKLLQVDRLHVLQLAVFEDLEVTSCQIFNWFPLWSSTVMFTMTMLVVSV